MTSQSSEYPTEGNRPLTAEQVLIEEVHAIETARGSPLPNRLREARGSPGSSRGNLGFSGGEADTQKSRATATEQHRLYQALNDLDRSALCLSGGGIRSAAFGLGVIQALATHPRPQSQHAMFAADPALDDGAAEFRPEIGLEIAPYNVVAKPENSLLTQLQYLSTVSGGGYIGSWLSAWRSRASLPAVWASLVGRPGGPDIQPHTIAWLRAYSSYVTPSLGALSGDTWTRIAISLHNLLLNWLVILPAISVVVLLLKMVAAVSVGLVVLPPRVDTLWWFLLVAFVLPLVAICFATRNRPSLRGDDVRAKVGRPLGIDQGTFLRRNLLPVVLGAGAFIQIGASNPALAMIDHNSAGRIILVAAIAGAVIYALGWLLACPDRRSRWDFWFWIFSGLVYGALLGLSVYVYNQAPDYGDSVFDDLLIPIMLGVPCVLLSQLIGQVIFVGLRNFQRTTVGANADVETYDASDTDREWLGRAAGWYLVTALSWFVVTFLIFAGPLIHQLLSFLLSPDHWKEIGAAVGAISGAASWIIARTRPLFEGVGKGAGGAKPVVANTILSISVWIFLALLTVFLSGALDELLLGDSLVLLLRFPGVQIVQPGWRSTMLLLLIGLFVAGGLLWLAARVSRRHFKWPRWLLFIIMIIVAPLIAAELVIWLPVAIDSVSRSFDVVLLGDPRRFTPAEAPEKTTPLVLGLMLTGLGAWVAARHLDPRRFQVVALALPACAFLVILIVAATIEVLAQWSSIPPLNRHGLGIFSPGWFAIFAPLLFGVAVGGFVTWVASRGVNINSFSLHAIYRNRLVRTFLGSSRPMRSPDAFSGLDEDDDPPMSSLWPRRHPDGSWPRVDQWRPFHIINIALNAVSTRHLSWQSREVASFTVSPLHSGSAARGYRRSYEYGGRQGISLGSAMAISGVTANPNIGYHASPEIAFVLRLFNLRLGWWLGNPGPEGQDTFRFSGPNVALQPLIEETFGLTTDERPYVYLSDGGHFDNLGLYEMVRRRCRYIIVVDVGVDPDHTFGDLGNAVRKISIDLGVRVRFHGLDKLQKRDPAKPILGATVPYHAVGEIDYPAADGGNKDDFGTILYIRPGYHGIESVDVQAYAIANPDFPHQETIDHVFGAAQFESYRALGFEITDRILSDLLERMPNRSMANLKSIFAQLRADTHKRSDGWAAPTC
jgi:hypothetical protein